LFYLKTHRSLFFLFLISIGKFAIAQNFEKIGQKDFMTIHGGINFNTVNYFVNGMESRRDPFTWFASGNVTISLLDVAIPLTYSYSNLGGKFTQPFNQFSLHPTYKWIKTHAGYSSMNFSNYTLAGLLFLGGGIELTPGKWNIQLMGGRLNKPIAYDAVNDNLNQICYKRLGFGMKTGYRSGDHEVNLILFKANDQENSLVFVPNNSSVKPMDNFVTSLNGKTKIFKNVLLEGEYAFSAITENMRDETEAENIFQSKIIKSFMNVNSSTAGYNAYKCSVGYKFIKAEIKINYEHIDPGYKTLGGYFFNNDLENYTLSYSANALKGKLNVGINSGIQMNNLNGQKSATTKRLVGSINISAAISQKINITGTYSNFSNFTRNRLRTDPFYTPLGDSLNFYNQTQNGSLASVFQLGNNTVKQNIQLMLNYNQSVNVSGGFTTAGIYGIGAPVGQKFNVYTSNLVYGLQWVKTKLSVAGAINSNLTQLPMGNSLFIGPMLNAAKTFAKGFSLNVGSVYNSQYSSGELFSHVFNHKLSIAYKPKAKNPKNGSFNLSCNANWMQKIPVNNLTQKINEINVFTSIAYAF